MKKLLTLLAIASLPFFATAQDEDTDDANRKYKWNRKESIVEYKGWALNSNFILPGIRFNFYKNPSAFNSRGTMEYFNSIGAGIGVSYGRIKIRSKDGDNIEESMSDDIEISMANFIGISAGVLFSQNAADSVKRNVFAPVINLQVLDFQVGMGYELGNLSPNYRRTFVTVTYSIPLQKLSNVGSLLLTNPGMKDKKKGDGKEKNIRGLFLF